MSKSEKKTMLIPTPQQFSLSKVKLQKNGGLTVLYEVTEVVGEESYINKYLVESAKDIHPDLQNLFKRLVPIMGRVHLLTSFLSLIESADFKATAKQKDFTRAFGDELLKNIEVRGISFSGQGDNVAVILSALLTTGNNQKTAINTPRLRFNAEVYGFEEDLELILGTVEQEVFKFLFKGKKATPELFGSNGDDEAGDGEDNGDGEDIQPVQVSAFPDIDDPADDDLIDDDEMVDDDEIDIDVDDDEIVVDDSEEGEEKF